MKYLKYFEEASAYEAYKNGSDYILPNVSYVVETTDVKFNPFAVSKSGIIMAKYNATDENMLALADTSNVKSLKVNGENVEFSEMYYFSGVGEYDVEIELIDNTLINGVIFDEDGNTISNSMFCDALADYVGACLTSIIIPNSVTTIGESAFDSCYSLTDVTIGSGVTTIGNFAFYCCENLTSAVIPNSVTSIGIEAFYSCYSLTDVIIGSSVTFIGENAFRSCTSLTSIVIPDSITEIVDGAFGECSALTEITCLAPTAPTIDNYTFGEVKNGGILKVPSGSDYSTWMKTDNYYLGYYNWTIEYI